MSDNRPPETETDEQWIERVSKLPGVIVYRNPNPVPYDPDQSIHVREGITVDEILGRYDDDDE
jgi:hypothetical protein